MDKSKARSQTFGTVHAQRPTVQKPGGQSSSDNKRRLVIVIKDVAVDCDKLQFNMSHKHKADCTAGQPSFCDQRTHNVCTLQEGSYKTSDIIGTLK